MHSLFCLHGTRDISFKKQQGKQLTVIYSMYINKQAKRALGMTDNEGKKYEKRGKWAWDWVWDSDCDCGCDCRVTTAFRICKCSRP